MTPAVTWRSLGTLCYVKRVHPRRTAPVRLRLYGLSRGSGSCKQPVEWWLSRMWGEGTVVNGSRDLPDEEGDGPSQQPSGSGFNRMGRHSVRAQDGDVV